MVGKQKIIAAIGNFDGVHLGHQALLRQTLEFAAQNGAKPGVIVFEPHPRRFFKPDAPPFLLCSPVKRDSLLKAHGVEEILKVVFNASLSKLSPSAFIEDVLIGRMKISGLVAGADFRFGANRAGDRALLEQIGQRENFSVKIAEIVKDAPAGEKFGSSAIRAALKGGAVDRAAAMLGRPWSVTSAVEAGQKIGRSIGFPTANMILGGLVEPRMGVYATRARVNGKTYDAVSNFGRRPTVGSAAPLLETHLFDFDGDLYGREMEVSFIAFLRDEQKFDGLDALKAQIADDCVRARALLG
jgi:riboflavin kinase/FMN adenylyltransferase